MKSKTHVQPLEDRHNHHRNRDNPRCRDPISYICRQSDRRKMCQRIFVEPLYLCGCL